MIEKSPPATPSPIGQPGSSRVRLDRRALLRAGAGATPVLLTLVSNPVAAANSCVVASSFVSVATFKSRNPTTTKINCTTKRVEDWRNACNSNPTLACVAPTVATTLGATSSTYNTKTLRQVLSSYAISTSGELGLLQHLTAMHLCLTQPGGLAGSSGNLTTLELRAIWSQYKTTGRYVKSTSGINWDSTQLIAWLRYQLNYSINI